MKKTFFLKLVLFLVPVMLYLPLAAWVSRDSGELVSLRDVAVLQMQSDPVLFGRAYRDNWFTYKVMATNIRKPDVLVLGSSRVMQFRALFFSVKPDVFYNAGGGSNNIYQMFTFLQNIDKDALPKLLIISLDQEWFNPKWPGIDDAIQYDEENRFDITHMLRVMNSILADVVSGKIERGDITSQVDPIHHQHAVGLNAVVNGSGFRNDGSYQYGHLLLAPLTTAENMAEAIERVAAGRMRFEPSDKVDDNALQELEWLLRFCQSNGIAVVGFSPPYAPIVHQAMLDKGGYEYIPRSIAAFGDLFSRYGFKYFDFTNIAALGITDDDMIDGFHASEFGVVKMLLTMQQNAGDLLNPYLDRAYLEGLLTRPNHFVLFEN